VPDAVVWVGDGMVTGGLDYGDRLVERLAARGLSVVRRDLTDAGAGVPRARLHVLSGGATSVNERSTWMPGGLDVTRSLVEAARRADHTVVGVCLGAQMIAETVRPGGVVGAERIEVGLTEVWWRGEQPMIVPAFHYERIDEALRGQVEIVAGNAHSPVQGFRLGSRVWGLQFHPELRPDDLRGVAAHHRGTIESYGGTAESALRSVDRLETRWTPDLFDRILDRIVW
jgi:GMP synthase-like glutamine amidotransferase